MIRKRNMTTLVLLLAILIIVNVLSGFLFTRFDLTSEKRFTLSTSTIKSMETLKDVVYIRVYLDGDFPPAFKKLQVSTREMLDELRAYSNGNLEYEFINPSANPNKEERNKLYQQLASKGIQPTNLQAANNDGTTEQIVFPGAIVSFLSQEIPVMLLQDQSGAGADQIINVSVQALEYNIANAIRKATNLQPKTVAFLEGHGEWNEAHVGAISYELSNSYILKRVRINEKIDALKGVNLLIVAGGDSIWSEKDKFIVDQFVMRGGKLLWLLDGTNASMDSLQNSAETIALAKDLNLEDMLFRYGARINYDLVLDLQSAPIPVVTGMIGNRPQQSLMPWYYFPLITPTSAHPIVKNLNAIKFDFVSTVDTVGARQIVKTILLRSSKYSRKLNTPVRVNLELMREKPDVSIYQPGDLPVAVLLEGVFTSNFKNRVPAAIIGDSALSYRETSDSTRMIVIGDANIIWNAVRSSDKAISPLGYDKYTETLYGNKSFLLNCIDYLIDDSEVMSIRSKEFKVRLLDNTRLTEELSYWKVFNTVIPVLLIALFGVVKFWLRKRKFAK